MDVLPADHEQRIRRCGEQLGDGGPVEPVALVFEVAQVVQLAARVLEPVEPRNRLVQLLGAAQDHLCLLLRDRPDLLDAVADDVPSRLVDVVADIVDCAREVVDVVAVERGHEGPVQKVDELARYPVAFVLRLLDLP